MNRLTAFAHSEGAFGFFLAVISILIFLLNPLVDLGVVAGLVVEYVFGLMLIVGGAVVARSVVLRWVSVALALLAMLFSTQIGFEARVGELACTLAYLFVLLTVLAKRVFGPGRVTTDRLMGAVAIYLLVGVAFAQAYTLLELFYPNSFLLNDSFRGSSIDSSLLYFSFVTLTTVGYGNATAINPLGHSLAVFEALVGQLYLTVLIGRLVSLRE